VLGIRCMERALGSKGRASLRYRIFRTVQAYNSGGMLEISAVSLRLGVGYDKY